MLEVWAKLCCPSVCFVIHDKCPDPVFFFSKRMNRIAFSSTVSPNLSLSVCPQIWASISYVAQDLRVKHLSSIVKIPLSIYLTYCLSTLLLEFYLGLAWFKSLIFSSSLDPLILSLSLQYLFLFLWSPFSPFFFSLGFNQSTRLFLQHHFLFLPLIFPICFFLFYFSPSFSLCLFNYAIDWPVTCGLNGKFLHLLSLSLPLCLSLSFIRNKDIHSPSHSWSYGTAFTKLTGSDQTPLRHWNFLDIAGYLLTQFNNLTSHDFANICIVIFWLLFTISNSYVP